MKKFVYAFLFLAQFIFAQEVDTLNLTDPNHFAVIDSISITGNDLTEEFIILRELTIEAGQKVNSKQLSYNRERVYSLNLFNYVYFYLLQENNKIILNIDVLEKWYFYPLPFLYFNEGEFKNPTYGINFRLENFRGRNESISAFVALGYDAAVALRYYNPAFLFNNNVGMGFELAYRDFSNKSYNALAITGTDFEYTFYSTGFSLNRRIDQFNLVSLAPSYTYIETDITVSKNITASGNKIDRIFALSAEYLYDSRDLKQFPKAGVFAFAKLTHKGFGIEGVSYNIFQIDLRQYNKLVKDVTARWRTTYRSAFGDVIPFYDYSYFGYNEYVRGHRDDDREGLHYILGSLEMSYAIVDEWDLSLNLPLLPRSLTSTRIGVNFNIFADAGATFDKFDELRLNSFISGYGFGLTVLFLPFDSIRFEYAFDEYLNTEFLIGLGYSF